VADYSAPLDDITFALVHHAGLAELAELPGYEHADAEVVSSLLMEFSKLAGEVIAPTNAAGDRQGVHLEAGIVRTPGGFADAYRQLVDGGWLAVDVAEEYGGAGFPVAVAVALEEMRTAANMALSLCPMLTHGAVELLAAYGDDTHRPYLEKLVTGEWTGTMCLTEPDAGSDLGAVRAAATPVEDGTWRVSGAKIFITWGEHDLAENIVHLVLARTPGAPAGSKGLSCFLVPKRALDADGTPSARNDVTCIAVEDKLGIHASPTCVLSFGEGGGAVGYLIGEVGGGLRAMFTMMNRARLSVGVEGLAIAERAYQAARAHAVERRQGHALGTEPGAGPSPIVEHADVRRMLLTMRARIEAMRALVYGTAGVIDRSRAHPDATARVAAEERVRLLIPVVKSWCTDLGVELASLGLQVHGGMGYVEETGAAQHYRDARIAPIYEGTNGIQADDLVRRTVPLAGGAVVGEVLDELRALAEAVTGAGGPLEDVGVRLGEAVGALARATRWLLDVLPEHPRAAAAGSSAYLRLLGDVLGGAALARVALATQARLAGGLEPDAGFLEDRVAVARFYAATVLPLASGLAAAATSGDGLVFAVPFERL
jgi:alkylation response protein AidB-like acyl-CoA dehydrogenase